MLKMVKSKAHPVKFRRKRNQRTNYRKRMKYLSSNKPRLVIRTSLKNIQLQVVEFYPVGDKVLFSATSMNLKKFGWKANTGNMPSAYLTGFMLGKMIKNKVDGLVPDFGLYGPIKGSRIYASLKGVIDAGIKVPCSEKVLPNEDRISGETISNYATMLKGIHDHKFSQYLKNSLQPTDLSKHFNEIKNKIINQK